MGFVRLTDCVLRGDGRDPFVQGDLVGMQILVMEPIGRGYLPADPVAAGHGDVDLGRVDVAQLIQLQHRLMREDPARPSGPESRLHVGVEAALRRQWEPIQTGPSAFYLTPLRHAHEVHRADPQLPRVGRRQEAISLVGDLGKSRVGTPGHPDNLAQNVLTHPETPWLQWGHALSLHGATREDVAVGQKLLE